MSTKIVNNSRCPSMLQDLITRMLHIDPTKRMKASEILHHTWLVNRNSDLPLTTMLPHEDVQQVRANITMVFNAINKPLPIKLNPVKASELARRRANRPSIEEGGSIGSSSGGRSGGGGGGDSGGSGSSIVAASAGPSSFCGANESKSFAALKT